LFCVFILYQVHLYFFLVGKFNIDFLIPSTSLYFKLLSVVCMSSFNPTQVVSESLHVSSSTSTLIVDFVFVPPIVSVQPCTTVCSPLANADHFGLQLACVHYLTPQMLDKVNYKESLALFICRVRPCC